MYDRILVPLDGSSLAEAALDVARLIPGRLAYLLRVEAEAPQVDHYISPSGHETHRRTVFREGDEYLQRVASTLRTEDRDVEVLQSWGDPAGRIVEAAADVDVIVMATNGRGAAGRILYGSVADRVAREASIPVLLVPGGYRPFEPPISRILVPLDGSELAETAIPAAMELARELGLPIHTVCVAETRPGENSGVSGESRCDRTQRTSTFAEHAARIYLADCIQRHGDAVATTFEVRSGGAVAELRRVIVPGDMVVMTTHGHRGLRRLILGSVADALVQQASAPILLLRAGMANATPGQTRIKAKESV